MDITKGGFYPYEFTSMATIATTVSTAPITSGALVSGAIYTILETPTGGTPSFEGAINMSQGSQFIATGTTAVWGTENTGKLVDVSTGKPTELAFYNITSCVFVWKYIYNTDDFCVSYQVTDSNGNLIN